MNYGYPMNYQDFDFSCPRQIIFGAGKFKDLPRLLEKYGRKVVLITVAEATIYKRMEEQLISAKKDWLRFTVLDEPSDISINEIKKSIKDFIPDVVIALGGGSVIDTGKVISALLNNSGDLMDYLEVVGKGLPLINRGVPLIAIPTTAGTGSEVTRNAVIDVPDRKLKVSLRSQNIQADVALVDPEFTLTLPLKPSIYSGMDAFIQVIEPYVSIKSNRMSDLFCLEGIRKASVALPAVFSNPHDLQSRVEMSWVSLLGGISLANAGLGAVHGFAGVIGGMYHAPHGAICASLLPAVMEGNLNALKLRGNESNIHYHRYEEIFQIVTQNGNAKSKDGLRWFRHLLNQFQIPSLRTFGIKKDELPAIIASAKVASSMKANPVVLSDKELYSVLENAY
jgi:alcohol dehydrogenase class IV